MEVTHFRLNELCLTVTHCFMWPLCEMCDDNWTHLLIKTMRSSGVVQMYLDSLFSCHIVVVLLLLLIYSLHYILHQTALFIILYGSSFLNLRMCCFFLSVILSFNTFKLKHCECVVMSSIFPDFSFTNKTIIRKWNVKPLKPQSATNVKH